MSIVYSYRDADWNNLEVLQRNRLQTRPFLCGCVDEGEVQEKKRANLRLLNGDWKFCGFASPFDTDDRWIFPQYDDNGWKTMPVPGQWQLNGFGLPHYTDAICLYPMVDSAQLPADNPTGAYRRTFSVEKQEGKEYLLRFDGVESAGTARVPTSLRNLILPTLFVTEKICLRLRFISFATAVIWKIRICGRWRELFEMSA